VTQPEGVAEDWRERSAAEISAGRLPLSAQARIAALRNAGARDFTSDLTVSEHHAVRSVGFHPVGQVLGSCVYSVGNAGTWNCGAYGPATMVPEGMTGSIGVGFGIMTVPHDVPPLREALEDGRRRALRRLRDEASALGADGVVAVHFTGTEFPVGDSVLEFNAVGTAVRSDGGVHPGTPFLSDLSGQDFAKLLLSRWVPVDVVLGVAVQIRHDDWSTVAERGSWVNTEVGGYTELVNAARAEARDQVGDDACAAGADGVVLAEMELTLRGKPCAGPAETHDHLAQALLVGTAVARIPDGVSPTGPRKLPMIRLDDTGRRR
jgi:uncharacterized protein YbjQ (UPF0145 family)